MNNYKAKPLGVLSLFFMFIFSNINIGAYEVTNKSWSYKDWEVNASSPKFTRFTTHGSVVHGHLFGMVKIADSCEKDILFISWSSYESRVTEFQGKKIKIGLIINDHQKVITIPLLSVLDSGFGPNILAFSNFKVPQNFITAFEKEQIVKVIIKGPEEFISLFDIKEDEFSLNGFIANRLKAQEVCESVPIKINTMSQQVVML